MSPSLPNRENPVLLLHESAVMDALRSLPDHSVDAVVTDPPYGLGTAPDALAMLRDWMETGHHEVKGRGFMGKTWDAFVPQPVQWREIWRVLKPGGHVLAFAGTRTQDLMALGLRLAGFEIRDLVAWVYGSGFPKSHNLEGDWEGWGTALKPALEPITLARKPLDGTVAANVLQWHTGALNVDACRVSGEPRKICNYSSIGEQGCITRTGEAGHTGRDYTSRVEMAGRWPANLIHDGSAEVLEAFPESAGQQGDLCGHSKDRRSKGIYGDMAAERNHLARNDTGSAARFFYCAKASKTDREEGLEGFVPRLFGMSSAAAAAAAKGELYDNGDGGVNKVTLRTNHHPTVKPVELMRYLCRLITPPGGVVLDPFLGSGSTGKAATLEGFRFIGIEKEAEYLDIARARIAHAQTTAAAHPPQLELAL